MAEVNRDALVALPATSEEPAKRLVGEKGPPLSMMASPNRISGVHNQPEQAIGKFDPGRITMRQRELMRRDPMIRMGLHFRKTPLIRAPWRAVCTDRQVAAFIEEALRLVWADMWIGMLLKLDYGWVPGVKRFKRMVPDWQYEDPKSNELQDVWPDKDIPAVVLDDFRWLHPDGSKPLFTNGGHSFDGFEHEKYSPSENSSTKLRVPVSHALWATNERIENFGDWWGYPATGYAFRFWWSYWYRWLLGDRHFEQDADPPLVVKHPSGNSPNPENPSEMIANSELALQVGQALRSGSTVAMPSETHEDPSTFRPTGVEKWSAEFLRGGENMRAFQESYEYLDLMKLRALMIPDATLLQQQGADTAERSMDALFESQQTTMDEGLLLINDHVIPDLLSQNFIDPPKCRIVTEGFRREDMEITFEVLKIVASNDPKALPVNLRKLSEMANLPLMTPEEVEQAKEERLQDAIAAQKAFRAAGLDGDAGGDLDPTDPEGKAAAQRSKRKTADARDAKVPSTSDRVRGRAGGGRREGAT